MKSAYSNVSRAIGLIAAAVFAVIAVLGGTATVALISTGSYSADSYGDTDVYANLARSYCSGKMSSLSVYIEDLSRNMNMDIDKIKEHMSASDFPYSSSRINFFFTMTDPDGNTVCSSYPEQAATIIEMSTVVTLYNQTNPTAIHVEESFDSVEGRESFYEQLLAKIGDDLHYSPLRNVTLSAVDGADGNTVYTFSADYDEYEGTDYTLTCAVPKTLTVKDTLYKNSAFASQLFDLRLIIAAAALLGLLLCVAAMIFVCSSMGHVRGTDELHLTWYDRIPLDLLYYLIVIAEALGVLGVGVTADLLFNSWYDVNLPSIILLGVEMLPFAMLALSAVTTFAARVKKGKFWRNTIIFYLLRLIKRIALKCLAGLRWLARNMHIYAKLALILCAALIVEFIVMLSSQSGSMLLWFVRSVGLVAIVIYLASALCRLQKGADEIAGGNLDYKIDLRHMPSSLRQHGERLNSIQGGLSKAVDAKMRSERMKTELITNVSHDIKTPLTSIINYVDLLEKTEITDPTAAEYIEVIDRQSHRLKKLLEDLVEAAKASSGNIAVHMERTDINVLLAQSVAEYGDRFETHNLEPVLTECSSSPTVMADGRLLWRVFDNLMNNIVKYAQPGTRVYIECIRSGNLVSVVFKNISCMRLNISGDELTERFVRGDESRNTEGSGLGLSIARSLTELQGGRFDIVVDGDLFKAIVTLGVVNVPAANAPQSALSEDASAHSETADNKVDHDGSDPGEPPAL